MANKELYKNICSARRDIPVFAQHWWLDVVCEDWDVAIATKGDTVTGVWPYSRVKRLGVNLIRTPKLTSYLGPVICFPEDIKESNRDGYAYEALLQLASQLPQASVWHLSSYPGDKQVGFYKSVGLTPEVQQTFLIDLREEEAVLLGNMKENLRRNIRTVGKEISITNEPDAISVLYRFHKHTLSAKSVAQAHTLADMERLMAACIQNDNAALWVAREGGDILALVWNVWDKERSYYFMGAQKPGGDSYRAISALLWHAMREAKARGNHTFDLEGSMDPGVERFFRSFGGYKELYLVIKKNNSLTWKLKKIIRK